MIPNLIISVGRQLGSGGCEIAKMLSEEFQANYYDKELINLAAERSGFNPRIFEKQDESQSTMRSLLNFAMGRHVNYYTNSISQESLFKIQSDAIEKAAESDSCVFVGRCADYILREKPHLFSVFITANDEDRVKTVAERLMCDAETASRYIEKKEAERASYYNYYTSKTWGASQSYDLCINSSMLGITATARLIASVIRARFNDQQ